MLLFLIHNGVSLFSMCMFGIHLSDTPDTPDTPDSGLLCSLDISNNSIWKEGAKHIAQVLPKW
jgi:hypothetical protein